MGKPDERANAQDVDLTNCDREPIHIMGLVQSYGALLALSADWKVVHASENIGEFLSRDAKDIIGLPVDALLDVELVHDIRGHLQMLSSANSIERIFRRDIAGRNHPVDIAVHSSGDTFIVEFEDSDPSGQRDYVTQVRPMIDRIAGAKDVESLCQKAARQLRALIGFDRVMVYRFEEDGSGIVVGEALRAGMEPHLGLRYPASDIPKQARALYKRSLLRIISDASDDGYAIIPALAPDGEPLDLSISSTRAVSPIHREYLRNMGVEASMSVSILKRGKLWGLFACHHQSPMVLPYSIRTAAELFGQLFSFVLDQKEADIEREDRQAAQEVLEGLMARIASGGSVAENFDAIVDAVTAIMPYDGAVGWVGGDFIAQGSTPTEEQFAGLAQYLATQTQGGVFHTDELARSYPAAAAFADKAAGMLALPVSRRPGDYLVLFRKEIAQSVTWAGNPEKPVESDGPDGQRLTPRKSFEAWQQVVRGRSAPWTSVEVSAAESLRVTLLEVVLKLTDVSEAERHKAQERQEILIAELNHRVRNILNLVRGLINQSKDDVGSVAELTEVIGGRIHSLARAHDQITHTNWSASSFHDLLKIEGDAYLGAAKERIEFTGPDASLDPSAYTTLALVIHELVTNAAKYGALSVGAGRVAVSTKRAADGSYEIQWTEIGGPPITSAPARRGFGSTIIERSIPYDLDGEAAVKFEPDGLTARFVIPAACISEETATTPPQPVDDQRATAAIDAALLRNVLVLEDNMIIALDIDDMLTDAGAAEVHVAASIADAIAVIEAATPSFALLDINVASTTSEEVANLLRDRGVPFAFATGYGDDAELTARFPEAKVLNKPFSKAELLAVFSR